MAYPKYKLVRPMFTGYVGEGPWGKKAQKVYRIKALCDIPQINVKAGDFGGLVTSEMNLSQFGTCWIDYHAKVLGHVFVVDGAYIGGKASVTCDLEDESIIIRGSALVTDDATVILEENTDVSPVNDTIIVGDITISDNATLRNVGTVRGVIGISDNVHLDGVDEICGAVYLSDNVRVNKGTRIQGKTSIHGATVISEDCTIIDSTLEGSSVIFQGETVKNTLIYANGDVTVRKENMLPELPEDHDDDDDDHDDEEVWDAFSDTDDDLEEEAPAEGEPFEWEEFIEETTDNGETYYHKGFRRIPASTTPAKIAGSSVDAEKQALIDDALLLLAELNEKTNSYESDIVKIIKYPVMADKGCDTTATLHSSLSRANRISLNPLHAGFVDAVSMAEKAFFAAESYALKMASTVFNDTEKKKVSKAEDLLRIAADDASTEHEKKVAFAQAFKQLEGVIAVPEVAVDTFRVKIGLKEIEGGINGK